MAVSNAQAKAFIDAIAPIIQKYAKQYGYKVASPVIAQACIESNYGRSKLGYLYNNYFGMKCGSSWKGRAVNLSTKEEYTPGTLTDIKALFRAYDSIDEGVKGYYEFISKSRYANLKSADTPKVYLERIKADGYATSSTYVDTCMKVVDKFSLTIYDEFARKKTVLEVALEVMAGKWGNGTERRKKLEAAGYDYKEVQSAVNKLVSK